MKKLTGYMVIIFAALLCATTVAPSWAYKFTVTNNTDKQLYIGVIWLNGGHNFGTGQGVAPGETVSYENTDWKTAGLCWENLSYRPGTQWSGCPAPDWIRKPVNKCQNVSAIITRSGCDLKSYFDY